MLGLTVLKLFVVDLANVGTIAADCCVHRRWAAHHRDRLFCARAAETEGNGGLTKASARRRQACLLKTSSWLNSLQSGGGTMIGNRSISRPFSVCSSSHSC